MLTDPIWELAYIRRRFLNGFISKQRWTQSNKSKRSAQSNNCEKYVSSVLHWLYEFEACHGSHINFWKQRYILMSIMLIDSIIKLANAYLPEIIYCHLSIDQSDTLQNSHCDRRVFYNCFHGTPTIFTLSLYTVHEKQQRQHWYESPTGNTAWQPIALTHVFTETRIVVGTLIVPLKI